MDSVYQREELLELYKNPINWGSIKNATVSVTQKNPMCGDVITLDLKIDNGTVSDAKFSGDACSVSTISGCLVTEDVIGKSVKEVAQISKEHVLNLIGINLSTSRVQCAVLILEALQEATSLYNKTNE